MYKRSLAIYTFAHFAVDFACFYVLFSTVSAGIENIQQLAFWFLTYNIIAFGLQFVVGFICDNRRDFPAGLIGIIITVVGLTFAQQFYIALILVALGNAFFHVGGGIDSLLNADGKMGRSGVFVSSGAWGVALGTLAGKANLSIAYPLGFLLISGVLIYIYCNPKINKAKSNFNLTAGIPIGLAIALIFVSVTIRAYTGYSVPITWKSTTTLILLATFASFFGKFTGGFIADKIGARTLGTLALLLSVPLLAFFNNNIILCVIGIALFNMTMPVTLCTLANYLEGFEGLAFGLTTLALLAGTAVTYYYALDINIAKYVIIISIIISALCIFMTTSNNNVSTKKEQKDA